MMSMELKSLEQALKTVVSMVNFTCVVVLGLLEV